MAMALGPAFLEAAKAGEVARLREMLAGGGAAKLLAYRGEGTPDAVSGNTALHWAAARGHAEALRVLLAAGAPLAITNHGGSTALQAAVLNGHVDAARLLRRHGADAHAKDEFGDSALDLAKRSQRNREEILTVLLEAIDQLDVADDNSCTEDESHDACKDTANGGSSDIAAKWKPGMSIIELRAAGNVAFERKEHNRAIELYTTALHGLSGDSEAEGVLWSNLSACYTAQADYNAALDAACKAIDKRSDWFKAHSRAGAALHGLGRLKEAEAAYEKALALQHTAADGRTRTGSSQAIEQSLAAVRRAKRLKRLEELIENGAFERRGSENGEGGDHGAQDGGDGARARGSVVRDSKTVKTAEEMAYAENVREWMSAAKAGDVARMSALLGEHQWLLSNRSENTAEKQLGNTALHWAAANGKMEAVNWLLSQPGCDINARNEGGGTALHSAAAHGCTSTVQFLVDAGAKLHLKDTSDDTATDAAWRRGYRDVEAIIDRGGCNLRTRWSGAREGLSTPANWEEAKAEGTCAYAKGSVPALRKAIWCYTDALHLLAGTTSADGEPVGSSSPSEHSGNSLDVKRFIRADEEAILRSNRSAAHARLGQFRHALEDADAAVKLRPQWAKGHGRRGAALHGLGAWHEAELAYQEGLAVDPHNDSLRQGREQALAAAVKEEGGRPE